MVKWSRNGHVKAPLLSLATIVGVASAFILFVGCTTDKEPDQKIGLNVRAGVSSVEITNLFEPKRSGEGITVLVNRRYQASTKIPEISKTTRIPLILFVDGAKRFQPSREAVRSVYVQSEIDGRDGAWVF